MFASLFSVLTIPPPQPWRGSVVLYLHGHPADTIAGRAHLPLLMLVAQQTGYLIVAPEYGVADLIASAAVFEEVERLYQVLAGKVGAGQVVLVGEGAGAGLALALCQRLRLTARPQPRQLVLLAPWLDFCLPGPAAEQISTARYCVKPNGRLQPPLAVGSGQLLADSHCLNPLRRGLHDLPPTSLFVSTAPPIAADTEAFQQLARAQRVRLALFAHAAAPPAWWRLDEMAADELRRELIKVIKGSPRQSFRSPI